jgi:hypothetical protein
MTPSAIPPKPDGPGFWRSLFKKLLLALILTPIVLGALYLAVVLNWSYSDGDRTGHLQKFSRKGWLCKTYEGELAMTTVPGVAPVIWPFSVRMWDDRLPAQINKLMGERVVLHYSEFRNIPTNCFGETSYFVDSVKAAD